MVKRMIRLNEQEFLDIVVYMRETYGINLEKKKVLIECRLNRELERNGCQSFGKYFEEMKRDKSGRMSEDLVMRLTTNFTYFWREASHFVLLKDRIFPEMFQKMKGSVYNIWCAGCSTGEECYTLAMVLKDYSEHKAAMPGIRIVATDISEEVLHKAKAGIYPNRELPQLPAQWQKKYCHQVGKDSFGINEELKYNIRFMKQNLMHPVSDKYDLILCRNVMIYFDRESRRKLVAMLENSLNPGGYLLIGHAELLSASETNLEYIYPAVYKKTDGKENQTKRRLYGKENNDRR